MAQPHQRRLAALGLGGVVWAGADNLSKIREARMAHARAWDIRGPACPQTTEAAFLKGRRKGPRKFDYQEASFYRHAGYVDCTSVYEDGGRSERFYPVCQFTSAIQIMVRTQKGQWVFEPGAGQPATVSTPDGVARCVMAAKISVATVKAAPQ